MNAYLIIALADAALLLLFAGALFFTAGSGVPSDAFDVHADEACELTQLSADEVLWEKELIV